MAGYYRGFRQYFATVVVPLTNLLSTKVPFVWSEKCQEAFNNAKVSLATAPSLLIPNFKHPFSVAVVASESGAGAVLMQVSSEGKEHPVCCFSKKFNCNQWAYSAVEREALALILAVLHFEVYLGSSTSPIVIYTDHNTLMFINKMRNHNQCIIIIIIIIGV